MVCALVVLFVGLMSCACVCVCRVCVSVSFCVSMFVVCVSVSCMIVVDLLRWAYLFDCLLVCMIAYICLPEHGLAPCLLS